jgi:hypothetical protein
LIGDKNGGIVFARRGLAKAQSREQFQADLLFLHIVGQQNVLVAEIEFAP